MYRQIQKFNRPTETIVIQIVGTILFLQTGLAVGDVQEIQEAAKLKKLAMQVSNPHHEATMFYFCV